MESETPPLRRLRLRNVRCFGDTEIPFDKRVTVIVGGNASGKTTLMEALACLTHGDEEGLSEFPLRHGVSQGEIALYAGDGRSAVAKWDPKLVERKRLPSDHFVFLYGRYRRVPALRVDQEARNLTDAQYLDEMASHAARGRTITLTRPDNRLLQDLEGYIRGLHFGRWSDPRLEGVWSRLNAALPELDRSLSSVRMDKGMYH